MRRFSLGLLLVVLLVGALGSTLLADQPKALSVITNSVGQKLVYLPAGKFTMGSPALEKDRFEIEGQVAVELTQGFYLGQTEVTQGEWKAVMGTEPWKGKGKVKEGAKFAATYVSWDDAQAFCEKLSKTEGKTYRLPTEAEWEYACRSGTQTAYSFKEDWQLGDYGWFEKNAYDIGEKYAHAVGQKKGNPFGLYDMHGNVWEWCRDGYDAKLAGGKDPFLDGGNRRVLRGGSWYDDWWFCRSAIRHYLAPGIQDSNFGFRVARSSPEQMEQIRSEAEPVSVGSRQPKALTSLTNTVGQTLLPIPAGEFLMGNEDSVDALLKIFPYGEKEWFEDATKQHKVRITQPFYLGKHEVTIGQFRQFVSATNYQTDAEKDGNGGSGYDGTNFNHDPKFSWLQTGAEPSPSDEHPVVNVSWNDAVAFCNWLSQKEGNAAYYRLPAGDVVGGSGYRLPSEAEWEYACRAGSTTRYYQGNDPETLAKVGNVLDNAAKKKLDFPNCIAAEDGYVFTAPVGKYSPNKFGLYDMHGNAVEWCGDWYAADFYDKSGQDDPRGPTKGTYRVVRGGGWGIRAAYCRSASRYDYTPDNRFNDMGFRVARSSDK